MSLRTCPGPDSYRDGRHQKHNAPVVELVDTQDLKSCGGNAVRVQVPSGVQSLSEMRGFFVYIPFISNFIQIHPNFDESHSFNR